MFPWGLAVNGSTKPFMEAAGIEPADYSPGASEQITDLDVATVGALVIASVRAAALCNHATPRNTASFYLHPRTREERFVVDILSGRVSTPDLMEQLRSLSPAEGSE